MKRKTLYQFAGSILMANRATKYLVFFIFSWIIYKCCFIFSIPVYLDFPESFYYLLYYLCVKSFVLEADFWKNIIVYFLHLPHSFLDDVINILFTTGLLAIPLLWIYRQNLVRAWLLAISGIRKDDSIIPPEHIYHGLYNCDLCIGLFFFTAFFFILVCINYVMYNSFPNNKTYIRIKAFFERFCIRP